MATKAKKTVKKAAKKVTKVSKVTKAKKVVRRKPRTAEQSFQVSKENSPFVTFKITNQTIYWSVLAVYILVLSVWVLKIQMDTLNIINTISPM